MPGAWNIVKLKALVSPGRLTTRVGKRPSSILCRAGVHIDHTRLTSALIAK
jgi:hypothetical protein